jgi:hypothetical protein
MSSMEKFGVLAPVVKALPFLSKKLLRQNAIALRMELLLLFKKMRNSTIFLPNYKIEYKAIH